MTVKELMNFLKECPEDADINVKNYINGTQYKYRIEELAGFFNGVKDVVNIYIGEDRGKDATTTGTVRETCAMRHENGNCLPVGGFCLAVNNEICEALQHAYECGASPVRHGHWITKVRHYSDYQGYEKDYCSLCGNCGSLEYAYCPTCGAKMDDESK